MNLIMFHSIGNPTNNWYRNWLSVSLVHFEHLCKYLKRNNYHTVQLDEWYRLQKIPSRVHKRIIALTFDDGYLDNWTFAYPIMKKNGLKGTVFVNPEFVDPSITKRKNLEDAGYNEKLLENEQTLGFLNWPEIQEMDESRVMDIQSHSMSHNFYFNSDKIIDIYNKQPQYNWPAWYLKPERKAFYITEDQTSLVPAGYPIFEFGRALGIRRYFPDERLIEFSVEQFEKVKEKNKKELIGKLNEKVEECPGRFETDQEMEMRYRYELFESKKNLEEKLNKKVEFLCWPGGGYNETSIRISMEAGYKASTLGSTDKNHVYDNSGGYKRIKRFGIGSFVVKNGNSELSKLPNRLVLSYKAKTGSFWAKVILKLEKILVKNF